MDLSRVFSRHNFFQQVRLMLRHLVSPPGGERLEALAEKICFVSPLSLEAPDGEIGEITLTPDQQWQVEVRTHGLTGALGALPEVYTEWLIARYYRYGDRTAKAFLDMFTNRLQALRYRSWLKYHYYAQYEASERPPLDQAIRALAGYGPGLAGHNTACAAVFAHPVRSMLHLEKWLETLFSVTVNVKPFTGGWREMAPSQRCCLGRVGQTLGQAPMIGQVCMDMAARFTVALGPVSGSQVAPFLPKGEHYASLWRHIRAYVGPGLDFDIDLLTEGGGHNRTGEGQIGRDLCIGQPGKGFHLIRLPAYQEKDK